MLCAWAWAGLGGASTAGAAEILMKDGRIFRGKTARITSLNEKPGSMPADGIGPPRNIVLIDDDLRRVYVPWWLVQQAGQDVAGPPQELFRIWQPSRQRGLAVKAVGPPLKITDFDKFGRRNYTFNTSAGAVTITQGITDLTPQHAKVEGITHVWDMRLATSAIPPDTLHKILLAQIDPSDIEQQKKIARFYLQGERYEEARRQLEAILKQFPNQPDLEQDLSPAIRSLRQLGAQRLLAELQLRRAAGQHKFVLDKLRVFPSEGVAGEILQAVREMAEEYETRQSQCAETVKLIDGLVARLPDTALRGQIEPIRREMAEDIGVDTLVRMAAFRQAADDEAMTPEERLALAISGWLLGSNKATVKLPVALSVYKVRGLVREYLNQPVKLERERIFANFQSEEGAAPELVAAMLDNMKPPGEVPEPIAPDRPGFFRLEVPGPPGEPPVPYLVQVPPEYDPYRRYPAVVTLHGASSTPEQQVDWWAGGWTPVGWRAGQATRYGYLVIAPQWAAEHQRQYRYSFREHAAVLDALRDACRRFSIDTDRVFLSGHSMGGDAAWDIGLAHPDLWAGVIPIVARSDKYVTLYYKNGKGLPFYVVEGELDGSRLVDSSVDLDRYLTYAGFNCTVVEYQGRGHDHFYEEILNLFDWMGRFRRDFFPAEIDCVTMRPWDNFFWWLEVSDLPAKTMVDPVSWPPPRGTRPMSVTGKLTANNGVYVNAGTVPATVWLSPKMVDFQQRVSIVVNGRRLNPAGGFIQPDLRTLLEDARTRGDRQHPFWAKVDAQTGRVGE